MLLWKECLFGKRRDHSKAERKSYFNILLIHNQDPLHVIVV